MSISLIYIILYHTNLCELKSYCVENRVVLHCKKTYGTIKYQNSWQLILSFLPPLRKTDEHAWVECKWTLGRLLSLLELSILAVGSIVRPPSLALAIRVRNRAGDPMSLTLPRWDEFHCPGCGGRKMSVTTSGLCLMALQILGMYPFGATMIPFPPFLQTSDSAAAAASWTPSIPNTGLKYATPRPSHGRGSAGR